MAKIIYNIGKTTTKLFLSFIMVMVFFFLYKTIPSSEFTVTNTTQTITNFQLFYYTLLTQMCMPVGLVFFPLSNRAKILTILQLIMGYSIYLL